MYIYTKIIDKKQVLYGTAANAPAATDLPVIYFKNDWSVISDIGDYHFFYDNEHQIYGNKPAFPVGPSDPAWGSPTDDDLAIYPYVESVDGALTPIISAIPGQPTVTVAISPTNAWIPAPSASQHSNEARQTVGK